MDREKARGEREETERDIEEKVRIEGERLD